MAERISRTINHRPSRANEIRDMATSDLADGAMSWLGQIRVEPNTHASVAMQAAFDLLLELKRRFNSRSDDMGTVTTVTVTAAQHGVMNPDGTWIIEEWEAPDAEETEV